jgi:hypothetical protein
MKGEDFNRFILSPLPCSVFYVYLNDLNQAMLFWMKHTNQGAKSMPIKQVQKTVFFSQNIVEALPV